MDPTAAAHPGPATMLSLYQASPPDCHAAHWRINGYPATVYIWTADEWDRLEERPTDAQYYPCGVWCALRLDG